MGIGGMSFGSLLLIFLIIIVLFGSKRLSSIGEDLGKAVRSFRKGLEGEETPRIETQKDLGQK